MIEAWLRDLRYAGRILRKTPSFAVVAVASAALGIGGCSTIFAIVNAALFRPLPVEEPHRLMNLSELDRRTGVAGSELSYPDFVDLRQARSFDGIAASDPLVPASIGLPGDPQRH